MFRYKPDSAVEENPWLLGVNHGGLTGEIRREILKGLRLQQMGLIRSILLHTRRKKSPQPQTKNYRLRAHVGIKHHFLNLTIKPGLVSPDTLQLVRAGE